MGGAGVAYLARVLPRVVDLVVLPRALRPVDPVRVVPRQPPLALGEYLAPVAEGGVGAAGVGGQHARFAAGAALFFVVPRLGGGVEGMVAAAGDVEGVQRAGVGEREAAVFVGPMGRVSLGFCLHGVVRWWSMDYAVFHYRVDVWEGVLGIVFVGPAYFLQTSVVEGIERFANSHLDRVSQQLCVSDGKSPCQHAIGHALEPTIVWVLQAVFMP